MVLDHYSRVYARQEYLTPGAPETVARIIELLRPREGARVLEIASGKGEAACVLAERTACRVLALDRHPPFLTSARANVAARGLTGAVAVVRGDGRHLPVANARFDLGYCIGAPSIVGLEPCLSELQRAVRPSGAVVVSDIFWHTLPDQPLSPEWGWLATASERLPLDAYRAALTAAGLTIEEVILHDERAWDAYHAPMRAVAAEERARGEDAFADLVEYGIDVEQRGVRAFLGYVTFVARKDGPR